MKKFAPQSTGFARDVPFWGAVIVIAVIASSLIAITLKGAENEDI